MGESQPRLVQPIPCTMKTCKRLATYQVGNLETCGTHVTWALKWQGVCDAPSYGAGKHVAEVRALSSWRKVGSW